jgi:protein TonB
MKPTFVTIMLMAAFLVAKAQQQPAQKPKDRNADVIIDSPIPMDTSKTVPYDPNRIFTSVEQIPEFPGGIAKFFEYVGKNLRYPDEARHKNIQGKVFVGFVVEKDGSLSDIKILRSASPDLDAEAVRLLKACPRWKPGIQNGRPVRVAYTMPIVFQIK